MFRLEAAAGAYIRGEALHGADGSEPAVQHRLLEAAQEGGDDAGRAAGAQLTPGRRRRHRVLVGLRVGGLARQLVQRRTERLHLVSGWGGGGGRG